MFVVGNLLGALASFLGVILNLWSFVILVNAILSWLPGIDPYHPAVGIVRRLADLVCDPIRRLVPTGSLGIDLSPLIAILLLQFTNQFLVQSLHELAQRMG
ncbi:MAG: YggT family protein [Candidatus Eiseniibacteriota bacterium]